MGLQVEEEYSRWRGIFRAPDSLFLYEVRRFVTLALLDLALLAGSVLPSSVDSTAPHPRRLSCWVGIRAFLSLWLHFSALLWDYLSFLEQSQLCSLKPFGLPTLLHTPVYSLRNQAQVL